MCYSQNWTRLCKLLQLQQLKPFQNLIVDKIFNYLGSNCNRIVDIWSYQETNLVKLIQKIYPLLQNCIWSQSTFINAFLLQPSITLRQYPPKIMTILGIHQCMKRHPQFASAFLKVDLVKQQIAQRIMKSKFPFYPCYINDFQQQKWQLDVLRLQRKLGYISTQRMKVFYLKKQVLNHFNEFYIKQDILKICKTILNNTYIQTIEQYPFQWFQLYFKQYKTNNLYRIKNLQIMNINLLNQLIQKKYINQQHILLVFKSCKIQCFEKFILKYKIKIDYQFIKKINQKSKKKNFWKILFEIANQQYIINFLIKYHIFDKFKIQDYSQILLQTICQNRQNKLLSYTIKYFTNKQKKQLIYTFNQKCLITNQGLFKLPIIAKQLNYYEYYFLVKNSHNNNEQCPQFNISGRFFITPKPQQYSFIPLMKQRIQIFNTLTIKIPLASQLTIKIYFLMKQVFQLSVAENQNTHFALQFKQKYKSWYQPIGKLIHGGIRHNFNYNQCQSNLISSLFIIINMPTIKIPQKILNQQFTQQMKIISEINSIFNPIPIESLNSISIKKLFISNENLKSLLFIYNFQIFMQQYSSCLKGVSQQKIDLVIYLKGIEVHLESLQDKYSNLLSEYLRQTFFGGIQNKATPILRKRPINYPINFHVQSLYLKKHELILCLLSYSQSNERKSLQLFKKNRQLAKQIDQYVIFEIVQSLNIFQKNTYKFDSQMWNNIFQTINQIISISILSKQTYKIGKLEQLQKILIQYQQILNSIIQKYNFKIINLHQMMKHILYFNIKNNTKQIICHCNILMNIINIICSLINYNIDNNINNYLKQKQYINIILNQKQCYISSTQSNCISFAIKYQFQFCSDNNIIIIHLDYGNIFNQFLYLQCQTIQYFIQWKKQLEINYHKKSLLLLYQKCFDLKSNTIIMGTKNSQQMYKLRYSPLLNQLESIEQKLYQHNKQKLSLGDVYGPIKIKQENLKYLIHCIGYYEFAPEILQVMPQSYTINYLHQSLSIYDEESNLLSDWSLYCEIFQKMIKNQKINKIQKSNIYFKFHTNSKQQLQILLHQFFLRNILKILQEFKNQSIYTYDHQKPLIQVSTSINNIFKTIAYYKQKSQFGILVNSKKILNCKRYKQLIQNIILMIQQSFSIIRSIHSLTYIWQITDQQKQNTNFEVYNLDNEIGVQSIEYEVIDQMLIIKLNMISSIQQYNDLNKLGIVSRKIFINSIFNSVEFMTDHFLDKNQLNLQCLRISTIISKKLNTTINIHIEYKQLYNYINMIKNQIKIRQIQQYLYELKDYLYYKMQKILMQYLISKQIYYKHQILIYNTFQSLQKNIQLKSIYQSSSITFQTQLQSNKTIKLILPFKNKFQMQNESIKNMFLIQIYKSYFSVVVSQGVFFILGYKSNNKSPQLVKFANKEDIDKVNLSELEYLLLVSSSIPTQDELSRHKIINIFLTDLNCNIYSIDKKIQEYMLQQKNLQNKNYYHIAQFLPIISSNIIIRFNNNLNIKQQQQYNLNNNKQISQQYNNQIQCQNFIINLNQMKFKMYAEQMINLGIINHLKRNISVQNIINQIIVKLKENFKQNLHLIIEVEQKIAYYEQLIETICIYLQDLKDTFDILLQNVIRQPALQIYLSVEKSINIQQNYFIQKRKDLFMKYIKKIKLLISTDQNSIVYINKQQIILKISSERNNTFIHSDQIICCILQYIIKQQLKNKTNIQIKQIQGLSKNSLLLILDIINQSSHQIQQIQQAILIYKQLQINQQKFNIISTKIIIDRGNKITGINYNQGTIIITINIESNKLIFLTSNEILSYLLNKFNNLISKCSFTTMYNVQKHHIEINNVSNNTITVVKLNCKNNKIIIYNNINITMQMSNYGWINIDINENELFEKYFLIDQNYNIAYNYIYHLPKRDNILLQSLQLGKIQNKFYMYLLCLEEQINWNHCSMMINLSTIKQQKQQFKRIIEKDFKNIIQIYYFSKQIFQLKLHFNYAWKVKLHLGKYICLHNKNINQIQLILTSNQNLCQEKTKFIKLQFRKKQYLPKQLQNNIKQQQQIKIKQQQQFYQPSQLSIIKYQQNKQQIIILKNIQSLVYVVNHQNRKYLTRAGQNRIDYIQLCDSNSNTIDYNVGKLRIYFKHVNSISCIQPDVQIIDTLLALSWKPIIRGQYQIYINNVRLNPEYQIGVIAGVADLTTSKVMPPKVNKICYSQETQVTFQLKDSYENIYTELEQEILGDNLIIQIISKEINKNIKVKPERINKYGTKKVRFSCVDDMGQQPQQLQMEVLMNKQLMCEFKLTIEGLSLKQRQKLVKKQIDKCNKNHYRSIKVNRNTFLKNLFEIAQKSMHVVLSISFSGQQGIDAGGLKRQFYDIIGNQFKNQTNRFFSPTDQTKKQYFINNKILNNKKCNQYMNLFGKYLANSILNGYLIGVSFSAIFIKLLYQDKLNYQDLFAIMQPDESKRYQDLLSYNAKQIEQLELYFIIDQKNKQKKIQLIQNGKDQQVTAQNLYQYFDLLTQVKLYRKYKTIMDSFRQGFNSVLNIKIIKQWIRADEFWCLTAGVKQITSGIIMEYVIFCGNNIQIVSGWFRRFINQSNLDVLQGFLKFASGSSSIAFNKNSKITVTFENAGKNPQKLPISHTCWKEIIIPKYKNYQIMSKRLNCAFLYCSQGFGIA